MAFLKLRDCPDTGGQAAALWRPVAAELVRRGLAIAVKRYSRAFLEDEAKAREAGAGAWAGTFTTPAAWRRR